LRFVSDLIFSLGEIFGTEIVILNPNEDGSFKEDLAQDVLEIITVVSAVNLWLKKPEKSKTSRGLKRCR
jgi:putative resolvase